MRGTAAIKNAREESKRRQEANSGSYKKPFILMDGEEAIVRFLESGDEIVSAYVHHVMVPGSKMPYKIVCRDQDPETGAAIGESCPGCESRDPEIAKRRVQGAINVIWRNAPVFERDSENKLVKSGGKPVVASREDQIAVWTSGVTVFDDLVREDIETPGGLTGRDWKVSRSGTGTKTEYDIRPAERDGGQKDMSKADEALAENKYDLTEYEVARPVEDWWGRLSNTFGAAQQQTSRPSFATQHVPADVSPFTNQ